MGNLKKYMCKSTTKIGSLLLLKNLQLLLALLELEEAPD